MAGTKCGYPTGRGNHLLLTAPILVAHYEIEEREHSPTANEVLFAVLEGGPK